MANAFIITNAVAQALATAFAAQVDAGTAAIMEIYDGSKPAGPETAVSGQTKLATLTFSATAFGSPADANPGASITANAITSDSSADDDGTATWFRILTQAGGTEIADGTVGTSSADLVMNTVAFTAGSVIGCSSFVVTVPEGP